MTGGTLGGVDIPEAVVSDSEITAFAPPAAEAGVVDLVLTGPGGTGTLPDAFTYIGGGARQARRSGKA